MITCFVFINLLTTIILANFLIIIITITIIIIAVITIVNLFNLDLNAKGIDK